MAVIRDKRDAQKLCMCIVSETRRVLRKNLEGFGDVYGYRVTDVREVIRYLMGDEEILGWMWMTRVTEG